MDSHKKVKQFFCGHVRIFVYFMVMLALITSFLLPYSTVEAKGNTQSKITTVKVGYFYNGDFMHKDNNTYAGYDVEYYYALATFANWKIEFVDYDSLQAAMAGLANGEIDIMSGLSKTSEREANYLISNQKMCATSIAVQVRSDDDRFTLGDTKTMTDMNCGILKGSNVISLYTNWCQNNGLTPHITEFNSLQERNQALANKEVDAIAAGSTIEGAQKIAEFPALDLYFMLNKNKAELKSQLDRAMGVLSLENPKFQKNLFEKYFPSSRNTKPSFSKTEKAYIKDNSTIRVGFLENDEPFSKKNTNGSMEGIIPKYYSHLAKVIGIKFKFISYSTKNEILKALKKNKIDIIGKYEDNIFDSNADGVITSVPYYKSIIVRITRAGTNEIKSAAVPECNAEWTRNVISKLGTKIDLKVYTNSSSCFEKLKSGKVDAVVCTQAAATWLLNRNRSSDYVVSSLGDATWNVSSAFRLGDEGNKLRSIVDKTITVDDGFIDQIITKDTLQDSADLSTIFDQLPVYTIATIAVILIILLVMAVVAIIVIIHQRKKERELNEQQNELAISTEANKARHAFFGAVSHDMRTPLNGIVGFTDMALDSDDPKEIKNYLKKIKISSKILDSLVNDTLIMSRIENGKYVLKLSAINLSTIFAGVLEPIQVLAKDKNITFIQNVVFNEDKYIMADKLSIQKVVLNLLSNSLKYTPNGGEVKLDCKTTTEENGKLSVEIMISDTGIGISEKFLPHVFEPFAQENPSNLSDSGSGLGLSIVKSIIDAMAGTINVSSKQNKGTTFTIHLTFDEVNDQDGLVTDEQDILILEGKRALVCEDNKLNLEIMQTLLKKKGMEVVSAENGEIGLNLFKGSREHYFDVILLDLRMPVMNGFDTAKKIRKLDRNDARSIPIIAVSADAYPENIQECKNAGMNDHIAKPIDAKKLYRMLSGYLS